MILSVREVLAEGAGQLRGAGIDSARLDARVLLVKALDVAPDQVFARDRLSVEEGRRFSQFIARRAAREPLAYITGTKEFWSLDFAVGPGVLIPRPETETLVEAALAAFRSEGPLRVLDMGTGSGCLIISFLVHRPNAAGVAVDNSNAALAWAQTNALALGVTPRCRTEQADWAPTEPETFDVIFSNPPYLTAAEFDDSASEIRNWEPRSALVGGDDGLAAMRALGPVIRQHLRADGKAFIEIGKGQDTAVAEILGRSGLDVREPIPDLSGVPRCLVVGRAGSRG